MYAVVKTGGKQYRVAKDDKIVVDRLMGEDGETVVLDQVLMMADGDKVTVGAPVIEGAVVGATVLRQTRP
jgi:large subunit ribosomal protein L21